MADINQIISLGIGTPADITHFILVGLSPASGTGVAHPPGAGCTAGSGGASATGGGASTNSGGWAGSDATPDYRAPSQSWMDRDYTRPAIPKRIARVRGVARPVGVGVSVGAGRVRATGFRARMVEGRACPVGAGCRAGTGGVRGLAVAVARVKTVRRMTDEEWFLLGLASQDEN